MKSVLRVFSFIVIAGLISSGCGALGGMKLALDDQVSANGTHGWATTTSAAPDLNADAGYLYGVWRSGPN